MQTKKTPKIVPVILAGGAGTRLWPLSTPEMPKQFSRLFGSDKDTLFQTTLERIKNISAIGEPIIICGKKHEQIVVQQCKEKGVESFGMVLEPEGRNTAPAIAIAALLALSANNAHENHEPLLLVLPSDHIIADVSVFHAASDLAYNLAINNHLICFGITPNSPETGYGYIQIGENIENCNGQTVNHYNAYRVKSFVEKPSLEMAKRYVDSKKYFWNGGMFMFKANLFLRELEQNAPDLAVSCRAAYGDAKIDFDNSRKILSLDSSFLKCRSESIDYAVMEKTANAAVVPLDAGWTDLGSWLAFWEYLKKDENGNVVIGNSVKISKVENSSVFSATQRKVVALGVSDCFIVDTDDAVLILNKNQHQELKKVIETIKA